MKRFINAAMVALFALNTPAFAQDSNNNNSNSNSNNSNSNNSNSNSYLVVHL